MSLRLQKDFYGRGMEVRAVIIFIILSMKDIAE